MKPAVETLLGEIGRVAKEIQDLGEEVARKNSAADLHDAHAVKVGHIPDLDDEGIGRLARTLSMDERAQAKVLQSEIDDLESCLGARREAESALACCLLQIAKQGISLAHGSLDNCPQGRNVEGVPLRDVVWHGRNQAMHFDEGIRNKETVQVCQRLERERHDDFAELNARSLALDFLEILEWSTWDNFERDLDELEV